MVPRMAVFPISKAHITQSPPFCRDRRPGLRPHHRRNLPVSAARVRARGMDPQGLALFRAKTRMRVICTFFPALTGEEVHDADGSL